MKLNLSDMSDDYLASMGSEAVLTLRNRLDERDAEIERLQDELGEKDYLISVLKASDAAYAKAQGNETKGGNGGNS